MYFALLCCCGYVCVYVISAVASWVDRCVFSYRKKGDVTLMRVNVFFYVACSENFIINMGRVSVFIFCK